jgi:hypothetical protein
LHFGEKEGRENERTRDSKLGYLLSYAYHIKPRQSNFISHPNPLPTYLPYDHRNPLKNLDQLYAPTHPVVDKQGTASDKETNILQPVLREQIRVYLASYWVDMSLPFS